MQLSSCLPAFQGSQPHLCLSPTKSFLKANVPLQGIAAPHPLRKAAVHKPQPSYLHTSQGGEDPQQQPPHLSGCRAARSFFGFYMNDTVPTSSLLEGPLEYFMLEYFMSGEVWQRRGRDPPACFGHPRQVLQHRNEDAATWWDLLGLGWRPGGRRDPGQGGSRLTLPIPACTPRKKPASSLSTAGRKGSADNKMLLVPNACWYSSKARWFGSG